MLNSLHRIIVNHFGLVELIFNDHISMCNLLLRFSEFYESASPKFKGNQFSRKTYLKWFNATYQRNYYDAWSGFNIPGDVFFKIKRLDKDERWLVNYLKTLKMDRLYVVAYVKNSVAKKHEFCHALYYLYDSYRERVNKIISEYESDLVGFKTSLQFFGYDPSVLIDEINAYFTCHEWTLIQDVNINKTVYNKMHMELLNEFLTLTKIIK